MDPARIAARLQPFLEAPLPSPALEQISIYIDVLLQWNARLSLTAVRNAEQIVTRHFGESFFLARHALPPAGNQAAAPAPLRVLDIGSGAGFPGLPLKIWDASVQLTLLESNHKKAAFLREAARELRLTGVNVIAERAESLLSTLPPAALVTLRAVERFDKVLPLATRFVAPSGRLALLIGSAQLAAVPQLAGEIQWQAPIPVPNSHSRVLLLGSK